MAERPASEPVSPPDTRLGEPGHPEKPSHPEEPGDPDRPAAERRATQGPVLVFTFLNSVGTGVVTTGIAFLAKSAYGFSETGNYLLGLILGVTYIVGAIGAGPALRRARRRFPSISTRAVLAGLMVVMAAVCMVPIGAKIIAQGAPAGGTPAPQDQGSWAIWVLIAVYSPLTGVLWPIVESYMSGGRSAAQLRGTMGTFNVVWSSALVVAYLGMAPLIKDNPLLIIAGVGGIHVLSILLVLMLTPDPDGHAPDQPRARPLRERSRDDRLNADLLSVFRVLLPTSYLVFSALTPYLPTALDTLRIRIEWQTPLAATWMLSRVGTFILLERWHGWHGRWATAAAGCGLLVMGFACAVLSPRLGPGGAGIALLVAGLAGFGVGMGVIYTSALYYALHVGGAQVEAGGVHEALIGCGYTAGPLCGLLAAGAVSSGIVRPGSFSVTMLALAGTAALAVSLYAMRRVWHGSGEVRAGETSV